MSKPSGQRTHKIDIEARRARGGFEATHQATHPQRDARRQAVAYRLANPLEGETDILVSRPYYGDVEIDHPSGCRRVGVEHDDPYRLAESYRTW